MIKPFSLNPLVNLAHQKNDAATRKLGQLNQQQQTAQTKLETLQQFRKDYQFKFQQAAQSGMDPTDLRNFQDFINRLDQAIQQQQTVIEKAKSSVQSGRHNLMDTTRKMKSFDTLAQRHVESEKKLEAKADQRLQDEQTGRFAAFHSGEKPEDK
ncbi:MAG: flagellar export protein FliJ [Pseudomonadota bacterium]